MKEYWDQWTAGEREQFQSICRNLLRHTFIVRDQDEDSHRRYFFISRSLDAFNRYFGYIGFEVRLDRDNGVAMLRNTVSRGEGTRMQTGHLNLKKAESLVLCCLWTLYSDRLKTGKLQRSVAVQLSDLRMEMEKFGVREAADKSAMGSILSLFARYHLLSLRGKIGEEDFRIVLYPSLLFTMDREAFRRFAESASARMKEKQPEGEETPEDEETETAEEAGGEETL